MFGTARHASDEEILKFVDHELSERDGKRLQEHLWACRECRDRQSSIEGRFKKLNEFYDSEPIEANSGMAAFRIRLREKLSEHGRERSPRHKLISMFRATLPIAAMTTLVAVGLALYRGMYIGQCKSAILNVSRQYLIPDRSLTPGAVRSVSLSEICAVKDDDLDPNVSASIQQSIFKEYGLTANSPGTHKYQIDYLVNPQLGGTDDIRNLWPQPYSNTIWNAKAKDELERRLHQMVCNHDVDLAEAQREIEEDWIAAYKKYLGRETS